MTVFCFLTLVFPEHFKDRDGVLDSGLHYSDTFQRFFLLLCLGMSESPRDQQLISLLTSISFGKLQCVFQIPLSEIKFKVVRIPEMCVGVFIYFFGILLFQ